MGLWMFISLFSRLWQCCGDNNKSLSSLLSMCWGPQEERESEASQSIGMDRKAVPLRWWPWIFLLSRLSQCLVTECLRCFTLQRPTKIPFDLSLQKPNAAFNQKTILKVLTWIQMEEKTDCFFMSNGERSELRSSWKHLCEVFPFRSVSFKTIHLLFLKTFRCPLMKAFISEVLPLRSFAFKSMFFLRTNFPSTVKKDYSCFDNQLDFQQGWQNCSRWYYWETFITFC